MPVKRCMQQSISIGINVRGGDLKPRPFTIQDKIYIAKYYDHDGAKMMADALDRTPKVIADLVFRMKRSGEWDKLKTMEWEG